MSRRRPARLPRATRRSSARVPHRAIVTYRRVLARRPWLHWIAVVVLAVATSAHILALDDRVEQARAAWGDTSSVLVADRAVAPGDPVVASSRDVPVALVPAGALGAPGRDPTLVARQHVTAGEIVTEADVAGGGPLALLPAGWLAVPIVESPSSGASEGDRVQLASDGLVVASDALVVGRLDDVTLVGVPAHLAASLAASLPRSAEAGGLVVLRQP